MQRKSQRGTESSCGCSSLLPRLIDHVAACNISKRGSATLLSLAYQQQPHLCLFLRYFIKSIASCLTLEPNGPSLGEKFWLFFSILWANPKLSHADVKDVPRPASRLEKLYHYEALGSFMDFLKWAINLMSPSKSSKPSTPLPTISCELTKLNITPLAELCLIMNDSCRKSLKRANQVEKSHLTWRNPVQSLASSLVSFSVALPPNECLFLCATSLI